MNDHGTFLERAWLAVSPEGGELQVSIRVGAPRLQPGGEWTAAVSLVGLSRLSEDMHGIDSWQAVEQAMLHAAKRITHLQSLGWQFYWDDADREPASPSELYKGV
jgi:hypothetical protein